MAATKIHLYSEFDRMTFDAEDESIEGGQIIWIRTGIRTGVTISLDLSKADRAKLRAALDAADAIADKT